MSAAPPPIARLLAVAALVSALAGLSTCIWFRSPGGGPAARAAATAPDAPAR